ncbi:MAG: TlpA family protein disulfide reductase [Saprospiraceae bacterium]
MKNLIPVLLLFLFSACQEQQVPEEAKVIPTSRISGMIQNPSGEKIFFYTDKDKLEAPLTDGKFDLEVALTEASYLKFKHGAESSSLFLKPGQQLELTLDTKEFDETIQYAGKDAAESNYLAEKYLLLEGMTEGMRSFFSKTPEAFTLKVNQIRKDLTTFYESYQQKHQDLHPHFLQIEAAQITYEWANNKLNYPEYHQYFNQDSDFTADENYDAYLKDLDLDNADLIASEQYRSFIKSHLSQITQAKINENPEAHQNPSLTKMNLILEKYQNPIIKDYLMFHTVKAHIANQGTKGTTDLMALFEKNCTDAAFKKTIGEDYKIWENLAVGKMAPDFKYEDAKGKQIALSDLRGKYVYIDVWATWCGPCMAELPHLEELQKQYAKSEKLVFASVSIDEDKGAWEKMVAEKEMMGVQLYADNAWKSSIVKDYKISGIPRFLLIDETGKIFDVKAPRPSSKKIKTIFAEITANKATSMK